jgi:hypothetical protein
VRASLLLIVALVAALALAAGVYVYFQPPPDDPLDQAILACQADIRDRLRSPKTAEFQPAAEWEVFDRHDGRIELRGYVDAQNGFGALIRNDVRCDVEQSGAIWLVIDARTEPR